MKRLLGQSLTTSSAIFLSRVSGLVRDILFTSLFGVSALGDAFNYAYRIPNLLRLLFGEGALSAAFIPVYSKVEQKHGKSYQLSFATNLLFYLAFFLFFTTLFAIVFAPYIVAMVAPGLTDGVRQITTQLTRVMLPYMLLIGISSILISVLNYHNYFFLPFLSSAMLNIGILLCVFIYTKFLFLDIEGQLFAFSWGVVVGGVLQLVLLAVLMFRVGYRISLPQKGAKTYLKRVWQRFIPGVVGIGIRQINIYVDLLLASFLTVGSASALTYSYRLMQLALGLFGVPIWSVSLPSFSKLVAKQKFSHLEKAVKDALILSAYVMLPITAFIVILAKDYIRVLFFRGAFGDTALSMTNIALIFYALGLVFYCFNHILVAVFYAFGNTKTPVKISAIIAVINLVLNLILMRYLAHGGLALATFISSVVYSLLLFICIHKSFVQIKLLSIFFTLGKLLVSVLATATILYFSYGASYANTFWTSLLRLFVFGVGGVILYLLFNISLKTKYSHKILGPLWKKSTRN